MPTPSSDPLSRQILSNAVRDHLRDSILTGALAPGTALHETGLMREYQVSRTTLRRALADLAEGGLVETHANRSPRVTDPADADVPDAVVTLGVLMRGIVRFTVPDLDRRHRAMQLSGIEQTITAIETGDVDHLERDALEGYHRWADSCPNPFLADALRRRVDVLSNSIVTTGTTVQAQVVVSALHLLRLGVHDGDPETAMRAIRAMHRPDRLTSNRTLRNLRAADAARWSSPDDRHA